MVFCCCFVVFYFTFRGVSAQEGVEIVASAAQPQLTASVVVRSAPRGGTCAPALVKGPQRTLACRT